MARACARSPPAAICTDAGTTRPALWSTTSEMVAAELDEVVTGAVLATLGARPQEVSARDTAAHAIVINAAARHLGVWTRIGSSRVAGALVLMAPSGLWWCAGGGASPASF